jgi:DNA-binding transcriptional ArsR family regulator
MATANFPVPPSPDEEPATPESTRQELLGTQTRYGPPIRSVFLQEHGGGRRPGPLHRFVHGRRLFALQLYLLLHCVARKKPWDATLPAATWSRALDKTNGGAEGTVSRSWAWLKDERLVRVERQFRKAQVFLLTEDASGAEYTRSKDFLYFPLAYFRNGWHARLSLSATSALLIAQHHSRSKDWFQLRTERESLWYGISPDTLQRGLDELREAGVLLVNPRRIRDNKARYGTTLVNEYLLVGDLSVNRPTAASSIDQAS